MSEDLHLGAEEFLRPVTLLARFLGRAKALNGGVNRLGVLIKKDSIELISSGKFGADIPSSTRADMAINTTDARMRGILVRDKLRVHDGMACLAAELDGVSKFVGLITPEGTHEEE